MRAQVSVSDEGRCCSRWRGLPWNPMLHRACRTDMRSFRVRCGARREEAARRRRSCDHASWRHPDSYSRRLGFIAQHPSRGLRITRSSPSACWPSATHTSGMPRAACRVPRAACRVPRGHPPWPLVARRSHLAKSGVCVRRRRKRYFYSSAGADPRPRQGSRTPENRRKLPGAKQSSVTAKRSKLIAPVRWPARSAP